MTFSFSVLLLAEKRGQQRGRGDTDEAEDITTAPAANHYKTG